MGVPILSGFGGGTPPLSLGGILGYPPGLGTTFSEDTFSANVRFLSMLWVPFLDPFFDPFFDPFWTPFLDPFLGVPPIYMQDLCIPLSGPQNRGSKKGVIFDPPFGVIFDPFWGHF